jgi:hypothetical protein
MAVLEALGVVFGLLGAGLLLAFCAWLAWWMLEPINRVAGELKGTTRFMLTDVLGLMILLQIGLAITGGALSGNDVRGESVAQYWLLLALMGILVCVLWAASVSVVSRAGITRPLRRIAVMVLCVPGTLAIMVTLPALIGAVAVGVFGVLMGNDLRFVPLPVFGAMVAGCVALALAAFALRCLSYWSLAGSPGAEALARLQERWNSQLRVPLGEGREGLGGQTEKVTPSP